ncbi:hypothetical protein BPLS_P4869 [Bathymodiolus platifrons methanotrophic gill symbiont]|uniref:hypothetical protein n=1 Tax=Bathymodiolus platifrons methanotrophic gill symbiont TaxID=113268 RepID=UPI001B77F44A|nr:hypothetical protein [Bathymodiolus platifrons methanotrophic gill symbiont]GFO76832.1 hypothetical protein BPLS_P4869 [Bathymodiolus platifrons methanotrophic gill symbiont]
MRSIITIVVLGAFVAAAYSLQNNPSTALYTPFFSGGGGGGSPARGDSAVKDSATKDSDIQSEKSPQSKASHRDRHLSGNKIREYKNSRIIKSPKNNHIINKTDRPRYKERDRDLKKRENDPSAIYDKQVSIWTSDMEKQGYTLANDYDVALIAMEAMNVVSKGSKSLREESSSLMFTPTTVKDPAPPKGKYLGHKTELGLVGENDAGWKGKFSRYYQYLDIGFVKLSETYIPDNEPTSIGAGIINSSVNGNDSYYVVQRSSSGYSHHTLGWEIGHKVYILESSNNNPDLEFVTDRLFNMAEDMAENHTD